ncbi:polyhydroxyalkanoic acid system family protein [Rhodoblastus sp.]|uniref:polyhydroxyalkanoic acid system family protein n=1 Tax=Rhodoblastus sp. TaxID=1962975 RepID=UPI003F9A3A7D
MAHIVTVDVPHQLGAEEAKRRVEAGIEALQQKFAHKLDGLHIDWQGTHADVNMTVMNFPLRGGLDFLPDCVRVSLDLPWALALIAEKTKGMISRHTGEMLQLPPPKA